MSTVKSPRRIGRRQFILGGLVGTAGLLGGAKAGTAAVEASGWPVYTSSGADGASVHYPSTWFLDPGTLERSLDAVLLYPHQSFALRTSSAKPPIDLSANGGGGLPDLTGYPRDSAIAWLMYYDDIVEGPPFAGLSLGGLDQLESEFDGFRFYVARFSNDARSFLLWVWLGRGAADSTVSTIDASLRTITVP
jgi:hypothetical protein